jgi:hypothetical protein
MTGFGAGIRSAAASRIKCRSCGMRVAPVKPPMTFRFVLSGQAYSRRFFQNERPARGDNRTGQAIWALGGWALAPNTASTGRITAPTDVGSREGRRTFKRSCDFLNFFGGRLWTEVTARRGDGLRQRAACRTPWRQSPAPPDHRNRRIGAVQPADEAGNFILCHRLMEGAPAPHRSPRTASAWRAPTAHRGFR